MVRIVFSNAETRAPAGTRLVDLCDELDAPIPFSCRDANCGTCLIEVDAGSELLTAPCPNELRVLNEVGAPKGCRLACQAQLQGDSGIVRIRAKT